MHFHVFNACEWRDPSSFETLDWLFQHLVVTADLTGHFRLGIMQTSFA